MAITLVRNDTAPALYLSLTQKDETGAEAPIDVSLATVRFKFRSAGATTLKSTVVCTKLTGRLVLDSDGLPVAIDTAAPYDVAGVGGRCTVEWGNTDLDTDGSYEGEVEITFASGRVMTVYPLVKFGVRKDFG
jgi:hypothetical protein